MAHDTRDRAAVSRYLRHYFVDICGIIDLSLGTDRSGSAERTTHHHAQCEQIREPKGRAASADRHNRVTHGQVGPLDRERTHATVGAEIRHALLAPVVPDDQDLKLLTA